MSDKEEIEGYRILYENAIKSSNQQDERKNVIDNKTNILLSIALVLLGIIIEFIDINKIFNYDVITCINMKEITYRVILFLLYSSCLINCLIIIIRSLLILRGKEYRVISPQNFVENETMKKSEKELLKIFTEEYVENAKINSESNKKQMESYDSNIVLLLIELVVITILYIGLKII